VLRVCFFGAALALAPLSAGAVTYQPFTEYQYSYFEPGWGDVLVERAESPDRESRSIESGYEMLSMSLNVTAPGKPRDLGGLTFVYTDYDTPGIAGDAVGWLEPSKDALWDAGSYVTLGDDNMPSAWHVSGGGYDPSGGFTALSSFRMSSTPWVPSWPEEMGFQVYSMETWLTPESNADLIFWFGPGQWEMQMQSYCMDGDLRIPCPSEMIIASAPVPASGLMLLSGVAAFVAAVRSRRRRDP
jgi:hypothetical protein